MNRNENINKMIEEALGSVDDAKRATPKPYLLTRINARMSKGPESVWEKSAWFITRPAVAFGGLCLVVLINTMVIFYSKATTSVATTDMAVQNTTDEFSYIGTTIYDNDNTAP